MAVPRVGRGVAYASGTGGSATATSTDFAMVCTVPCGKALDRNYEYVFQNVSGFQAISTPFILPARGDVTLKVESRSQGAWALGFVGSILSGSGVMLGATIWGVGAGAGDDGMATAGVVTTLISAPFLAGSIYLMAANGTSVTTEQGEELAEELRPGPEAPRLALARAR